MTGMGAFLRDSSTVIEDSARDYSTPPTGPRHRPGQHRPAGSAGQGRPAREARDEPVGLRELQSSEPRAKITSSRDGKSSHRSAFVEVIPRRRPDMEAGKITRYALGSRLLWGQRTPARTHRRGSWRTPSDVHRAPEAVVRPHVRIAVERPQNRNVGARPQSFGGSSGAYRHHA